MPDKQSCMNNISSFFNSSVNVVEIVDIHENINSKPSSFTIRLKSNTSKTLSSENRIEFVHVFDGLRCLTGLEMQV